jgi:GT2 family glycosyltransferase
MVSPKVVVVIAAYNAGQFIGGCLGSLKSQSYDNIDIYLVDNNSKDDTLSIAKGFDALNIIENKENRGVCEARNRVIEATDSKYILTLDSDMVLDNDFISTMVKEAELSSLKTGAWGGTIIDMKDKRSIDSLGISLSRFWRFYDLGSGMSTRNLDRISLKNILGPCACAGLYLRSMLESIREKPCFEYFDSKMHYLVEDFDLAIRARENGWKFKYVKDAGAYHYRHGSKIAPKTIKYLSFRNRYYLILKNSKLKDLPYLILSLFFYDLPRIAYLSVIDFKLLKKSISDLKNTLWKKDRY